MTGASSPLPEPSATAGQARHKQPAAGACSGVRGVRHDRRPRQREDAGFAIRRIGALPREGVLRELLGVPTSAETEARRLGIPIAARGTDRP